MKAALLFLITLSLNCNAQSDSIFIDFTQQTNPDCYELHPANGSYLVTKHPIPKLKIPGFIYVDPALLAQNGTLTTYSHQPSFEVIEPFYYDVLNYDRISVEDADKLIDSLLHDMKDDVYYSSLAKDYSPYSLYYNFRLIHNFESEFEKKARLERARIRELERLERERIKDSIWRAENPNPVTYWGYSNGIIDGVFFPDDYALRGYYLIDIPFSETSQRMSKVFADTNAGIREALIQPKIDELLSPFYMSKTEVTNKQYREFVHWVRDSIARELLYFGLEEDEDAEEYIIPGDSVFTPRRGYYEEYEISDREINRKHFPLNMEKYFSYSDPDLIEILRGMFYPQQERFYKRRQIDERKLNYVSLSGDTINVYPDTTGFVTDGERWAEPLSNMYHWHYSHDNYPIVNVSYKQVMAYCEWKQRQINAIFKDESIKVKVSIPTLAQYEFSLKQSTNYTNENEVHDEANSKYVTYQRSNDIYNYLKSVNVAFYKITKRYDYGARKLLTEFNKWQSNNYNHDFRFINGNVSEMVMDSVTQSSLERYGLPQVEQPQNSIYAIGANYSLGVKALSDDQYSAVFYKQLMDQNYSNSTTGFRLVYQMIKNDN